MKRNDVGPAGRNGGSFMEHVLVCVSSSPTNARLIRKAYQLAKAFGAAFTALYIETDADLSMSGEDSKRKQENARLAQELGARYEEMYGADVPAMIAEYARASGVTKIVIGRSMKSSRKHMASASLVDRLIAASPDIDIYIIPDQMHERRRHHRIHLQKLRFVGIKMIFFSLLLLLLVSVVGVFFSYAGIAEVSIVALYIFAVFLIAVLSADRMLITGMSLFSVLIFNFLFTEPHYSLRAYDNRYTILFLFMFLIAFLTGTMAAKIKKQAENATESANRMAILFDFNRILGTLHDVDSILKATAQNLHRLLQRDIVLFPVIDNTLGNPQALPAEDGNTVTFFRTDGDREAAERAFSEKRNPGGGTGVCTGAGGLYYSLHSADHIYAVVGIDTSKHELEARSGSIVFSLLQESALALDNINHLKEKEQADLVAHREHERANLLRSISHDLRTPLTTISGNAGFLLSSEEDLGKEERRKLYRYIYDDAVWLGEMVENLLSLTRIEDGRQPLQMQAEFVGDVVDEAVRHSDQNLKQHPFKIDIPDEFLFARMDASLIVQVLVNLINNAVRYTPESTPITLCVNRKNGQVLFAVKDEGPGIPAEDRARVFDMFYSRSGQVADGKRGTGLGLALCRSIMQMHGGDILLTPNEPHGCIFSFELPAANMQK